MRLRFLTPLLAAFLAFPPAFGADLPVPRIERLPNGLELAWFVSDSLPVIDLALMVKSGSRDDLPGKSGTSELLSASLDRGAGGLTAAQLSRAVESLGASRFASADEDAFSVGLHGLAPDAATLLGLLGKIALRPEFPPADVAREHARILDRWAHVADYGETLAAIAYRRQVASGTPYGRGSFLSVREFASVGRQDAIDFHRRHFTPKNCVLMIVGRVDPPEFRKEVIKVFGTPEAWSGEAPARGRRSYATSPMPAKAARGSVLVVDRPSLTQAQVRMGFRAPLIDSPDHYALVVANTLLGEYFNSRLNALLRDKLGLTYGIGSAFSYSRELAIFTITSATRNESVGPLIARAKETLAELVRGPIPEEEAKVAREYLEGSFPLGTSTLGAVAARWLAGYVYDLGPGYLNEFVPRVRAVTAAQALAAARKHLDPGRLTVVVAGDAKEIGKSLAAAKLGPVVTIGPDRLR